MNDAIAEFFIDTMAPYHYVEKESFRNIIWSADPKWNALGRAGLSTLLYKKYKKTICKVKDLLSANKSYLSMEMDIWTDRRMRSFSGVCCRVVKENFQVF